MNQPQPTLPRRKSPFLNTLLFLMLLLLVFALVVILLAGHRPGFYVNHSQRDRNKLARGAEDFIQKAQLFVSVAVLSEHRLSLDLTEDDVNGYLAAVNDPAIWDGLSMKFEDWRRVFTSDWLRDVQVSFRKGRITVAGEIRWKGFDLVLSVYGLPHIDREGKVILHVDGVRVGAMPLPGIFVRDLLRSIQDRPIPASAGRWHVVSVTVQDGKTIILGEAGPHKD